MVNDADLANFQPTIDKAIQTLKIGNNNIQNP
jgi:hypothetical protein